LYNFIFIFNLKLKDFIINTTKIALKIFLFLQISNITTHANQFSLPKEYSSYLNEVEKKIKKAKQNIIVLSSYPLNYKLRKILIKQSNNNININIYTVYSCIKALSYLQIYKNIHLHIAQNKHFSKSYILIDDHLIIEKENELYLSSNLYDQHKASIYIYDKNHSKINNIIKNSYSYW